MSSWIAVQSELPSANEVVEVCVAMNRAGSITWLRGYRLETPPGLQALWLNALTHEPFPQGWRVTQWRRIEPVLAGSGASRRGGGRTNITHKPA